MINRPGSVITDVMFLERYSTLKMSKLQSVGYGRNELPIVVALAALAAIVVLTLWSWLLAPIPSFIWLLASVPAGIFLVCWFWLPKLSQHNGRFPFDLKRIDERINKIFPRPYDAKMYRKGLKYGYHSNLAGATSGDTRQIPRLCGIADGVKLSKGICDFENLPTREQKFPS